MASISSPTPFLFFLFTISLLTTPTTSAPNSSDPQITDYYSQHCNHIVPESPLDPTSYAGTTAQSLSLRSAFYTGADTNEILNQTQITLLFQSHYAHKAIANGIYNIQAKLTFLGSSSFSVRFWGPGIPVRRGVVSFLLYGFWSESTGKLCMVGAGRTGNFKSFNVLLKLNYPKNDNLSVVFSLITGVFESLDNKTSLSYFEPVSILGIAQFNENYDFKLIEKGNENGCLSGENVGENLSLKDLEQGMCSVLGGGFDRFELDYGSDCGNDSCNILGGGRYLPDYMLMKRLRCVDKRKVQMLLGFRNMILIDGRFPTDPNTTLIAEGAWNEKKNQLCAVACRIMNFTESLANAFVGDCSIRFSLRFPAVLSLRNWSMVVGQIWSNKTISEPGYFGKVGFWGSRAVLIPGRKYEYTFTKHVRTSCPKMNTAKGKTYPTADSYDMRFDMSVRNRKGQVAQGSASPLFVGDRLYQSQFVRQLVPMVKQNGSAVQLSNSHNSQLNVSYQLHILPSPDFKLGSETPTTNVVEIAAEGMYDRDTGVLCMKGCRHLGSNDKKLMKNDSQDCDIVVGIQFSPLNAKGSGPVKGTIESTRKKSDPLYFEHLELVSNSIYTSQAAASIWRMDLEITMVLISNTLACVFVGLQLFHMKKHPDVPSFISVLMLVVLTLGHMIPLLLNFEAMFKGNRSQQNVFLESGGWLEVNEIIVRVVTMVAFLLQFRLLQLTWSARKSDESRKDLWDSKKKVLYVALPLYICGGLISWFIHEFKTSHQSPFLQPRRKGLMVFPIKPHLFQQQRSLWGDLRSYGGLVLDGFLLPQILFNIFFNSREHALSASFYMGTTLVHLLPHAYDLYRAHSSTWCLVMSYIYANHKMDLYSTAWDIIIPCGGFLFAVLIFLQQRFGGLCILPNRFRESYVHEKVPVVSSEELQGEPVHQNLYTL